MRHILRRSWWCRWEEGVWSACSEACREGVQIRSVQCTGPNGVPVMERECSSALKPPEERPCEAACQAAWEAEEWSEVGVYSIIPPCKKKQPLIDCCSCSAQCSVDTDSRRGTSAALTCSQEGLWTQCSVRASPSHHPVNPVC